MSMNDLTLTQFTHATAGEGAPGGGATAALAGSQGAALAAMVCEHTIGRKKYAEHQELAATSKEALDRAAEGFLELIDLDKTSFDKASAAFVMPKSTDAEKAARKAAVQDALKICIEPPYKTMELALETLRVVEPLVGRTNATTVSDLGVSALCLTAAARAAWLNVLANAEAMSDRDLAARYQDGAHAILREIVPLAEDICERVETMMKKS